LDDIGTSTTLESNKSQRGNNYEGGLSHGSRFVKYLTRRCAAIEGAGEVDQGRQAMLEGHYKRALGLFEEGQEDGSRLCIWYRADLHPVRLRTNEPRITERICVSVFN